MLHPRLEDVTSFQMLTPPLLEQSLEVLGQALADRGLAYDIVVVGGGSLMLLGLIGRSTADLDVVAIIEHGRYLKATTLPTDLQEVVRATSAVMGIRPDWINPGPTSLLDLGLPEGFAERTIERVYGTLVMHLAGRNDQVFLKLYAAADQGSHSKHFEDLLALEASEEELLGGARWTLTHDPSPGFRQELIRALVALGVENAELRI
ncbi:DUF6036 family nucleotidyltransferase [Candidatus Dormiibacter inghamiae]